METIAISLLAAFLTALVGAMFTYLLLIPRLDERIVAQQRTMDERSATGKEADGKIEERMRRLEDHTAILEATMNQQYATILQQLGELNGRSAARSR